MARHVSNTTQTRTYQLANDLARFPAVDNTAQVDLNYSTRFYEKTHRGAKPKGFFAKTVELFNPFAWSGAFWFALVLVLAVSYLFQSGLLLQMRNIRTPLFSQTSILTVLRINVSVMIGLVLLVLHLNLNYRRRGPGRIIKAYWYAMWVVVFYGGFSTPWYRAVGQHHTNLLNHYCFVQKNHARCNRAKKSLYASKRREEFLAGFSVNRRAFLASTFKTWDAERANDSDVETNEEPVQKKKPVSKKKQIASRDLENSRRWAYTH